MGFQRGGPSVEHACVCWVLTTRKSRGDLGAPLPVWPGVTASPPEFIFSSG